MSPEFADSINRPQEDVTKLDPESYAARFGLVLGDLDPDQAMIMHTAQKVEPLVQSLKIKFGSKTVVSGEMISVEKEVETTVERTTYIEDSERSPIPANQMDVGVAQRPEDLPDALPSEWLLEELAPELFYHRLGQGQVLAREWQETTHTPVTSYETVKEKIVEQVPALPKEEKQHAYVLLDTSQSMSEFGKYIMAKALALAFLRQGFDQRAQLAIRGFSDRVQGVKKGKSQEQLNKIAAWLLKGKMDGGGTNIQIALEKAVKDIKAGGSYAGADILLISDGLSYLDQNPLGDIKLHTLLVGSDFDPGIPTDLREWSTSFRVFSPGELQKYSKFSRSDGENISRAIATISSNVLTQADIGEAEKRREAYMQSLESLLRGAMDYDSQLEIMNAMEELRRKDFERAMKENLRNEEKRREAAERERLRRERELAEQESRDEQEAQRILDQIRGGFSSEEQEIQLDDANTQDSDLIRRLRILARKIKKAYTDYVNEHFYRGEDDEISKMF